MHDATHRARMPPSEWAGLCVTVAALLPNLDWRENGLGVLQAYLLEGETREIRVHVWSPLLERPGIRGNGNIHDHRFDMISRVLVGAVHHGHIMTEPGSRWQMCEVVHARKAHAEKGSFDCEVIPVPGLFEAYGYAKPIPAGMVYTFGRGHFHESYANELAVTIVEKRDQRSDIPARILWPAGQVLTHAFGGPPSGAKDRVLAEAKAALIAQWEKLQ